MNKQLLAAGFMWLPLVAVSQAQTTEDFSFKAQNFTNGRGSAKLTLAVTNNSASAVQWVMLECGFLNDKGQALTMGSRMSNNLQAGQTGYVQITVEEDPRIKTADCRVSDVSKR